jgi:CysZ protein
MNIDTKGNNPLFAADCLVQGGKLLIRPELRKFILIPVMINVLLYASALLLGYHYMADLIAQFIPGWLQWLSWILWPLFFLSFFIIGFFTFTLVANLMASPFYGHLSAKTYAIISGQKHSMTQPPVAKVVLAELKRLGYFASRAIPLLLLSLIPVINVLAPLLWGLFGAWGMALEYLAYPLEYKGLLFSEQRRWAKTLKTGALSFGGLAAIGLAMPIANIFVAPVAVIAATIFVYQCDKDY